MGIAALITWVLTAGGGFVLLSMWLGKGGHRSTGTSHFPPPVIFGHFALAAIGLIIWIIYLVVDEKAWAWVAFGILVPVALLGLFMFARWIPAYRTRNEQVTATSAPAESHFPVALVVGHGVLAVATEILVLLTALDVGAS